MARHDQHPKDSISATESLWRERAEDWQATLDSQTAALQTRLDQAQGQVRELSDKLTQQAAATAEKVQTLASESEQRLTNVRKELTDQLTSAESTITQLKQHITDKDALLADANKKTEALETEIKQLNKNIETISEQIKIFDLLK